MNAFPHDNIAFPRDMIAFPHDNIAFPRDMIAFPHDNIAFPRDMNAFPHDNIAFPRDMIAFPHDNIAFPRDMIAFPHDNIAFPRDMIAFPHDNIAFPRGFFYLSRYNAIISRGNVILSWGNVPSTGVIPPPWTCPDLEILKTYAECAWQGPINDVTRGVSRGGGCLSIVVTSREAMPKGGGACECPRGLYPLLEILFDGGHIMPISKHRPNLIFSPPDNGPPYIINTTLALLQSTYQHNTSPSNYYPHCLYQVGLMTDHCLSHKTLCLYYVFWYMNSFQMLSNLFINCVGLLTWR